MQSTKYAIFKQGNVECGLNVMEVQAIEKVGSMKEITDTAENIKGIINLRNMDIPVYSLRGKFGLADKEPDENTRLLIVSSNGILMAYEVDEMMNIVELETDQLYEPPTLVKNKNTSYLDKVAYFDGKIVFIMNPDGILTDEEQKNIKVLVSEVAGKED